MSPVGALRIASSSSGSSLILSAVVMLRTISSCTANTSVSTRS
jgi:hypothetical protein